MFCTLCLVHRRLTSLGWSSELKQTIWTLVLASKYSFLNSFPPPTSPSSPPPHQSFKVQAVSQLRASLGWLTVSVQGNELHSSDAFMLLCWVVQVWPFHLFPLIWKSLRPTSPFIRHTARPPVNTHMQSCTLSATQGVFKSLTYNICINIYTTENPLVHC